MVGSVVLDNVNFLSKLATSNSSSIRREMILGATRAQLLAILETCINILRFRFPLSRQQKKRLKPYAALIRLVARKRTAEGVRDALMRANPSTYRPLLLPVVKVAQACTRFRRDALAPWRGHFSILHTGKVVASELFSRIRLLHNFKALLWQINWSSYPKKYI